MKSILRFSIPAILFAVVIAGCKKEDEPTTATQDGPFYLLRYCEVLIASLNSGQIQADVYATIGCNTCPQEDWEALDFDSIASEYNALMAIENGPRYWVLDSIDGSENPSGPMCGTTFGNLDMTLQASVVVPAGGGGNSAYTPTTVDRTTTFFYNEGREVYQLKSATDSCYIMQSYTELIDNTLEISALSGLGQQLNLPSGWEFTSQKIDSDLQVSTINGQATVVTDELRNTYQLLDSGCLD